MTRNGILARLVLALCLFGFPAFAQQARTGVVQITVEESMGMVGDLTVSSAGRTAKTDDKGTARLVLPVGRQTISVTGIGY
jgi:hypothetical protein